MDQHSSRPKTLNRGATVQQKVALQNRPAPKAPPVFRPQPTPRALQTKTKPQAPPAYRPQPPRIQAKFAGPARKPNLVLKGIIQRHPMITTIEGRDSIHTDTGNFKSIDDVTQYLPHGASSSRVMTVCIRKESRADHQYVIATTACGINLKMHLGSVGAEIRCGREISPNFGVPAGDFQPKNGLTLGDAVGIFYQHAHQHAFHFENYNCARFASDLAGSLGTYIRGKDGDDFDVFL